jgi:hypothetical protein
MDHPLEEANAQIDMEPYEQTVQVNRDYTLIFLAAVVVVVR